MPSYEISPYGFFSSNYDITNEDDDGDAFGIEQDDDWLASMFGGYQATMTVAPHPQEHYDDNSSSNMAVRIQEGSLWDNFWTPTFELYNRDDVHYATLRNYAADGCCNPDFYEIARVKIGDREDNNISTKSIESDDDEGPPAWITVEEEFEDMYLATEPNFIFRRTEVRDARNDSRKQKSRRKKTKAIRVAKLFTDFGGCSQQHSIHISKDTTTEERQTILAAGVVVIKLKERKRQQQQQHQTS